MGTGLSKHQKKIMAFMSETGTDVNTLALLLDYQHHVVRRSLRRLESRGLVYRSSYQKQRGYIWYLPEETTQVVNIKQCPDFNPKKNPDDVYIGRFHACPRYGIFQTSKWHNPFKHDTREKLIEDYRKYIVSRPDLMDSLSELKGKRLGCWCKPKACHGDVLVELMRERERRRWGGDFVSKWPSAKTRLVLAALYRIGWQTKRQSGTSHRVLEREG